MTGGNGLPSKSVRILEDFNINVVKVGFVDDVSTIVVNNSNKNKNFFIPFMTFLTNDVKRREFSGFSSIIYITINYLIRLA